MLSLFGTQQQHTLPLRKMPLFQGAVPRHTIFTSSCVISLYWDSARIMFLRVYCFVNVLTLSCLGSLKFGTHPYYSLNPYMYLYYMWSVSIAKDRGYPKYFILYLPYYCRERPHLPKIFYAMCGLFLSKDRRFAEECSPRHW